MDKLLRQVERMWAREPTLLNWIQLLRISETAGQPRFTREKLVTALGPGEVIGWETSPTGFKAKVQNGVYPHRKHVQDLTTNSGYPMYEIHEDCETVRDTTNWDGWLEVAWRDDDDEPELQIQVEESWQFGPETYSGLIKGIRMTRIMTRDYRYAGSLTNDDEMDKAMFDYDNWESMD